MLAPNPVTSEAVRSTILHGVALATAAAKDARATRVLRLNLPTEQVGVPKPRAEVRLHALRVLMDVAAAAVAAVVQIVLVVAERGVAVEEGNTCIMT